MAIPKIFRGLFFNFFVKKKFFKTWSKQYPLSKFVHLL